MPSAPDWPPHRRRLRLFRRHCRRCRELTNLKVGFLASTRRCHRCGAHLAGYTHLGLTLLLTAVVGAAMGAHLLAG